MAGLHGLAAARPLGATRPGRRELAVLAAAVVAGVALRLAYVLVTQGHQLAGDEVEYDIEGRFAAAGQFLWSTTPYGEPHASMWKTPGYSAFVGLLYKVLGTVPDRVLVFQAVVLAPLAIGLAWALGRSLFGPLAGGITAVGVALYPNAWQFDVRLYSEAIATPLTLVVLLLALGAAAVGPRRAALTGLVLGLLILVKPSAVLLAAPIAVCWWGLAGARRGTGHLALTLIVALLVVLPWSLRNLSLDSEHFVPLSVQGAAAYGVFNDDAANDPEYPWAWRPLTRRDRELLTVPRSDGELYHELNRRTRAYIRENPWSVPQAFLHNGVLRLWDLRAPRHVMNEVRFEGRTRAVTATGLALYWPLLALAVAGLVAAWRDGRRRLVLAVCALALAASVVYTADAGTRYRAPFEPLIVALAASALVRRLPARLRG